MRTNGFTSDQRRILDVLSDGLPHRREELRFGDGLRSIGSIKKQVCLIRKILREHDQDIVCTWHNRCWCYRWVASLTATIE